MRPGSLADAPRRAFTLIELLVVIAIIALLVGILLPSLAAARATARQIKCLAQMHQIELAHLMYINDHRERFVDAALAHGGIGDPKKSWPVTLSEYNGGPLILRSPVDTSPVWPVAQGGQSTKLAFQDYLTAYQQNPASLPANPQLARWTSYGLNNYLARSKQPPAELMKRSSYDALPKIHNPAATVHFLQMTFGVPDPTFANSDHVHVEGWDNGIPNASPTLASAEMQINAHGGRIGIDGRANYTFLDGHAELRRFDQVYTDFDRNDFDPDSAK